MDLARFGDAWFAVQVRPGHERVVAATLRHKGYQEFLPLGRVRRRWSDRIKQLEVPLFPGYLFCRFKLLVGGPVITTPGVIRIVGAGRNPVAVSDEEIESVRRIVEAGVPAEPWPFIRVGQVVRVDSGPLRGLVGIVLRVKNDRRLVVSVSLLQRSVAVELADASVTPAKGDAVPANLTHLGKAPELDFTVASVARTHRD